MSDGVEAEHGVEPRNDTEDVLGLDQPIKLVKRVKVARLDNQRIFNPVTGLDYILKHHTGVLNTIKRNDKKFQKRYGGSNQKISKQVKYDHEYDNLSTILQFYQLWCHGLFPKANFKDCIHLLRKLGSKSPQLRLYRRELIERELEKLKIQKGIIVQNTIDKDPPIVDSNSNENLGDPEQAVPATTTQPSAEPDLDDWSFMNVPKRSNGLFIGEDDEEDDNLYTAPSQSIIDNGGSIEKPQLQPVNDETTEIEIPHLHSVVEEDTNNSSDDPFSDDEQFHTMMEEEPPNENDILQDDHDLELMREMDMN